MKAYILFLLFAVLTMSAHAQMGLRLEYIQRSHGELDLKFEVADCEKGNLTTAYVALQDEAFNKKIFLTKKGSPPHSYKLNPDKETYSDVPDSIRISKEMLVVTKLNQETVAGYNCVHALVVGGRSRSGIKPTYEFWTTTEIPNYKNYLIAFNSASGLGLPVWTEALKEAGCDGLPVKAVHIADNVHFVMELIKLEEMPCDDASFTIPTGYKLVPFDLND